MINFDIQYVSRLFSILFRYLHVTMSISIFSMIIALFLGVLLALVRVSKVKTIYFFSNLYVSFFRGTPLIAQLFLLYFGFPQVIPLLKNLDAYTIAIIGLGLNASAYMSESIRAAINSIDKGQMEACLSVGMSYGQAMRRIIFPQAARVALPSIANNFIDIVKGSSLAFTIGVAEIMGKAQMEGASSYRLFESYLAVALLYWIVIIIFEYIQKVLERKMNAAY
ncbi:amino acid ABC transporter permease [Clostridium aestuarii]|uniref:Amino acid ABC transporter permease n=1 Tax=Clostridium aestuarii TaxID=338193 RepID=A0ABT4D360_9CLOT|nr:amino acid ABC transporter permease [Clostridium aestuarii]MCY6485562.1 amino acid ABC transporter permease [Clostridium aestuarii]